MDKHSIITSGKGSVKCVNINVELDQNHITDGEVSGRKAIRKHASNVVNELSGSKSNNESVTASNTGTLLAGDQCHRSENKDMVACDPCRTEEAFAAALMYCQNCEEYLCKTCVRFHRKFSATAAHSLRRMKDCTNDTIPAVKSHVGHLKDKMISKLYDMVPTHCTDINVNTSDDKKDCNITGCEILSSGDLVLCDNENSALKLLNMTSHQIISKYNLHSNPWDVTVTKEQEIAVSLPLDKMIQLLSVSTSSASITCIRCLKVDGSCLGLEYYNDKFIVSYASKLEIISVHGTVTRCFSMKMDTNPRDFGADPWYIAINYAQNCVYVSHRDSNEISRLPLSPDQHIKRLKDENISYPAGMCVANGSELVVCNWDTDTIHLYGILNESGKKPLLDKEDGLRYPQAVCYSHEQKKLFVSSYWYDGDPKYLNNIKVFQFMHMVMFP